MSNYVLALAVDSAGNLYAGGRFTSAGGVPANRIAKWDGSAWSALGSGIGGVPIPLVYALAVDSADNLYAGGQFTTAGGKLSSYIALYAPGASRSELAVDFGPQSIWHYDGAWGRLTSWDPGSAGLAGGLAADFDANGLWSHDGTSWKRLTSLNAKALASWSGGLLAADFGANGPWSYDGATWRKLTSWNPGDGGLAGWSEGLAVDFDSNGTWSYDGTSWRKLTGWDPGAGGLAGWTDGLAVDFDANGTWGYDGTS